MVKLVTLALSLALAPPGIAPPSTPPEALPPPFSDLEATSVPSKLGEPITIFATKGAVQPLKDCDFGTCFRVVLEKGGQPLCLQFDDGPSADPTFSLYAPADVCLKSQVEWPEPVWTIGAKRIVIPGRGAFYTAGHTNTRFNARRKFEVKGRQITEVKQPFLYVGRTTTVTRLPMNDAVRPIPLRADRDRKAPVVATLIEGSEVEILLAVGADSPWFLVKTSLGLLGWYETQNEGAMPDELGIRYAGD
jgi:hypothetical protein